MADNKLFWSSLLSVVYTKTDKNILGLERHEGEFHFLGEPFL